MTDFEQFWARFPRKVGRLAAEQRFTVARKRASQEDIIAGVDRYLQSKPAYADWCHPKTWLAQGRWMDEQDATPGRLDTSWLCRHTPTCGNRATCAFVTMRNSQRKAG